MLKAFAVSDIAQSISSLALNAGGYVVLLTTYGATGDYLVEALPTQETNFG